MKNYTIISGSLRKQSLNTALARSLPGDLFDLSALPFYNGDIEAAGFPQEVLSFADSVEKSDGLLVVSPEYNGFFTPVVHNALDWLSRPAGGRKVLIGKPVALFSAAPGQGSGVRALEQLKHYTLNLKMRVYPYPFGVGTAHAQVSDSGRMDSPEMTDRITAFMEGFEQWYQHI